MKSLMEKNLDIVKQNQQNISFEDVTYKKKGLFRKTTAHTFKHIVN